MLRREFLLTAGGMGFAFAAPARTAATVLYGGRAIALSEVRSDAQDLWVRSADLPRINEFEVKRSRYVLSDEEFARRVKPRTATEMEAEASFTLAVWFHEKGQDELASRYWHRAQQLNPDDWSYYRQEWSFTPQEAGKKWLEKFQKSDRPYYPKLEMKEAGTRR